LGFSGNGSGQATFRTGLDVYSSEKSQDLESLAYDQQKAFGCAIIGPGAMPEFQAPEIVDGDGFTWRIDTTTAFLSTDFYKFGKTKKLSNPIARLAAGKSFSFFSGSFKRTLTDNIGGSAEQLTESYVATVSFTRNR
jgi:hypothetical protein